MAKKKKRKPRRCRICKKSPVWRGGDVKDPGPFCKRCYHKHIWPERRAAAQQRRTAAPIEHELPPVPDSRPDDAWYWISDEHDDEILASWDLPLVGSGDEHSEAWDLPLVGSGDEHSEDDEIPF